MKKSLKIIGAVCILSLLFGCENGQLGTITQISGSGYKDSPLAIFLLMVLLPRP